MCSPTRLPWVTPWALCAHDGNAIGVLSLKIEQAHNRSTGNFVVWIECAPLHSRSIAMYHCSIFPV